MSDPEKTEHEKAGPAKTEPDKKGLRIRVILKRPKVWVMVVVLLAVAIKVRIHDLSCPECAASWSETELRIVRWPMIGLGTTAPELNAGHPAHARTLLGYRDYGLFSFWE